MLAVFHFVFIRNAKTLSYTIYDINTLISIQFYTRFSTESTHSKAKKREFSCLKRLHSISGKHFMRTLKTNWQKRQAIRIKLCHAYLDNHGYVCALDDVGFGLEEAYNLVMTLWHQHQGVSVKRCMQRFAEALEIQSSKRRISTN